MFGCCVGLVDCWLCWLANKVGLVECWVNKVGFVVYHWRGFVVWMAFACDVGILLPWVVGTVDCDIIQLVGLHRWLYLMLTLHVFPVHFFFCGYLGFMLLLV